MLLRRLALAASLALGTLLAASPAASACVPPDLRDHSRLLLGAYVNPDETWNGLEDDQRKVDAFEANARRRLDIDMHYYRFHDAFPTALEEWDASRCRLPMIAWAGTNLDEILAGRHDALLRNRARAVQRFGKPIFIRWGYEMNGDWWDWTASRSVDTSTKFVSAWRRIHRIFRTAKASNALWVWSPNETAFPTELWKDPRRYYPGDDVVDWIGMDGYNWGSTQSWGGWRNLDDIFRPLYDVFAGRKPLMISETASAEHGGDKAAWIDSLSDTLAQRFPAIRALVWFHSNKETDWRIDSTPTALDAFRRFAATTASARRGVAIASTRADGPASKRRSTRRTLRGQPRR